MTELAKNQIYEALCTGYTSDGMGVVKINGRAVFVNGLIAGEKCRVRILKVGKNAVYGKIEELLMESPHRVRPDCPVYGRCGGCALRHMDYQEELEFKRRKVSDALHRIGGIELEVPELIGSDSITGYRNKTICSVAISDGKAVTGFYRQRTHDIVPADGCAIESDYARRAAKAVCGWMDEYGIPDFSVESGRGIRRVFCRYGQSTGEGQTVIITGKGPVPHIDELVGALLNACPETVSIMRNINADPGDTVLGDKFQLLWGREYIVDRLMGMNFKLTADSFYQINSPQAQRLYGKALEFAALDGKGTAVDLYCGAGTITMCLAKEAREVIGVEIVERAVESARESARENGIENVRFVCSDAAQAAEDLLKEGIRPDVITVDPPRRGLSPKTPDIIASMAPDRIVYVSCDPATLARDLKRFTQLGYTVKRLQPVDMFPRTSHVECVVLLSKLNAK